MKNKKYVECANCSAVSTFDESTTVPVCSDCGSDQLVFVSKIKYDVFLQIQIDEEEEQQLSPKKEFEVRHYGVGLRGKS